MLTISWFRQICIAFCLSILFSLAASAQIPQPALAKLNEVIAPLLTISGEVEHPVTLGASDLAKLPHRQVQVQDRNGVRVTFSGVPLVEVLRQTGVPLGKKLHGTNMAIYLLVEAADGYRVVFALPEIDPTFTDRLVLLADSRDGRPLSVSEGRLRLVVPDEKRQARWVRKVIKLRLASGQCWLRNGRFTCSTRGNLIKLR